MTDAELIARLRNHATDVWHYAAADRIEAQAAEIERLKAALQVAVKVVEEAGRRRGEAEAELARLIQKQGGGDA